MKNSIMKCLASGVLTLGLAASVQATLITGNIGWSGLATLDTGTAATATTVKTYTGPLGSGGPVATGDPTLITLMGGNGAQGTFNVPWNFTSSSDIPNFWTANGGAVSFEIKSYTFSRSAVGPSVAISGIGVVTTTAAGYDPTDYSFNVTFQDPPAHAGTMIFTFSASQAALPDGGITVTLLGAALSVLGLIRRKLA